MPPPSPTTNPVPRQPAVESQRERWVKYGANVGLSIVAVIVLAIIAVHLGQRYNWRRDVTSSGQYSLRPQTINLIKDLERPLTLVSLYPRMESLPEEDRAGRQDLAQPVADLLEEYRRKSRNISVEIIDPVKEPTRIDALLDRISSQYGGNVKAFRDALEAFLPVVKQLQEAAAAEVKMLGDLPLNRLGEESPELQTLVQLNYALQLLPQLVLGPAAATVEDELKQKMPDYKGAADDAESALRNWTRNLEAIVRKLRELKSDGKTPPEIAQYLKDAADRLEAMKKPADEAMKRLGDLGELKLDEIRRKLRPRTILVMGESELKTIAFDQVWSSGGVPLAGGGDSARLRFSGEQQISGAILSLSHTGPKPKVAFVRPGGPPVATGASPFGGRGGEFSIIAERLRDYNFEVIEKDVTGQYAMQARMQGLPAMPEPDEEELKDAIWVVLSYAPGIGMMGPNPLGQKLSEHLKRGGSALVMFSPQADNLDEALKEWGISVNTDAVIVHEPIRSSAEPSGDFVEQAQREPAIFVLNDFGAHEMVRPLFSLDAAMVPMLPVSVKDVGGVKAQPIIPIPDNPRCWGERDVQGAMQFGGASVQFDAPSAEQVGDIPPPLFAGAVAEKEGGGRLVVISALGFATNGLVNLPDEQMARRYNLRVARFPGNAELFTNAIFWLARQEKMLALSPSALEISRIPPINRGVLNFWRIGVLLIGLPGAVLASGLLVYIKRRD